MLLKVVVSTLLVLLLREAVVVQALFVEILLGKKGSSAPRIQLSIECFHHVDCRANWVEHSKFTLNPTIESLHKCAASRKQDV